MEHSKIPLISISGSPADMGAQQGRWAGGMISRGLRELEWSDLTKSMLPGFVPAPLLFRALAALSGPVYRRLLGKKRGRQRERLEGIFEAAGLPAGYGCLLAAAEALGTHMDVEMGCTTLAINHCYPKETFVPGVPATMLVQEVLEMCETAADAARHTMLESFGCPSIVTAIDRKGEIRVVEMSGMKAAVRDAEPGSVVVGNRYKTTLLRAVEQPNGVRFSTRMPSRFHGFPLHRSSDMRESRCRKLLSKDRGIIVAEIEDIMMDHGERDIPDNDTICRHSPFFPTISSAIFLPSRGEVMVLHGFPCENSYEKFSIRP